MEESDPEPSMFFGGDRKPDKTFWFFELFLIFLVVGYFILEEGIRMAFSDSRVSLLSSLLVILVGLLFVLFPLFVFSENQLWHYDIIGLFMRVVALSAIFYTGILAVWIAVHLSLTESQYTLPFSIILIINSVSFLMYSFNHLGIHVCNICRIRYLPYLSVLTWCFGLGYSGALLILFSEPYSARFLGVVMIGIGSLGTMYTDLSFQSRSEMKRKVKKKNIHTITNTHIRR